MARIVFEPYWEQEVEPEIQRFFTHIVRSVYVDAWNNTPVDTGALKADLDWQINGHDARVGYKTVDYAVIVEEGSRPHIIEPRDKKALYWPGAAHPVKRVNHPGTVGQHMLRRALYRVRA